MLGNLFEVEDFLAAAGPTFALEMNALQKREKPRASGLASCARQQAYMMSATPLDSYEESREAGARWDNEDPLTQEQGRMFEDLSVAIIKQMGYAVVDRQVELPEDYPVTGHPDGRLAKPIWEEVNYSEWSGGAWGEFGAQPDDGEVIDAVTGYTKDIDGLVWGFEHKHLGQWGYLDIIKEGFRLAKPEYVLQSALYGDALGWDAAQFVIIAQDASAIRSQANQNMRVKSDHLRWAANKIWNPKVTLHAEDLRPLKHTLVPAAHTRARWLTKWMQTSEDPSDVAREFDPEVRDREGRRAFPCGYCPYLARCLQDGQSGRQAPLLPFKKK